MSNELKKIQDAEQNSLIEFLSGFAYAVCGYVVVRKNGAALEVEADPFGWLVAVTPLDDELGLLADMCKNYESVVGKPDHSFAGTTSHLSAALQAIEMYNLKKTLLALNIEYTDRNFGVNLSAEAFAESPFSWGSDQESILTPVGSYAGKHLPCGGVSLSVYL